MSPPIHTKLFRSLYVVNKRAKQASKEAQRAYKADAYDRATEAKQRKEHLYDLKSDILDTISEMAVRTSLHTINGRQFYYLVFEVDGKEWGFHAPTQEIALNDAPDETKSLDDFEKSDSIEAVDVDKLDYDPTYYLGRYLSRHGSTFSRWSPPP